MMFSWMLEIFREKIRGIVMKKRYLWILVVVLSLSMALSGGMVFSTDTAGESSPQEPSRGAVPMAEQQVTTFQGLKDAIANGDDVLLAGNISVTETIDIPADYSGTIRSDGGHTLTLATGVSNMFRMKGATVTFDGVNLDGAGTGRLIHMTGQGKVTYKNGTISNGTSGADPGEGGGGIFSDGGTLIVEGSVITGNVSVYDASTGPGFSPHGGAVFMRNAPLVSITDSTITNNSSGDNNGDGGAIFITDSKDIQIHRNTFSGNHAFKTNTGGYQGGSIKIRRSDNYSGTGNTFQVASKFNTGGAVKLEGVKAALIDGDSYTMADLGDAYGISGGAISTENSNLTIKNSSFTVSGNSKVTYAGGVVTVVGGGEFNLINSTMTGRGMGNGLSAATYGGAIAFETGSTVKALIQGTTIKNFNADQTGGAITLSTKFGDEGSAVDLTIRNTTINNTGTLLWDTNYAGGAIYVGKGNHLSVDGGVMDVGRSSKGGLIYNHGETTITGGAKLTGGIAFKLGGGIYNDGYLKLDAMSLDSHFVGENSWSGNPHPNKPDEYGGVNIYAAKDVIITPNASITNKDVRVLDGTSAVILTGALENPIYVSISEKTQPNGFVELPQRYIGYAVAKGDGTYVPTKGDAQKIQYMTKKDDGAEVDDHTSIGKWDYVLDPAKGNIVLGQRAKMTYHANGEGAAFPGGEQTKDQPYEIYSSQAPWTSPQQMATLADEDLPARDGFVLAGWYTRAVTDEEVAADKTKDLFDFDKVKFTSATEPITTIVDPNHIHAYAGWLVPYEVIHKFVSGTVGEDLPQGVLDLLPENQEGKVNGDTVSPTSPSATEVPVEGGKWIFKGWDPKTAVINNGDVTFTGTWVLEKDQEVITPDEPEPPIEEPVSPVDEDEPTPPADGGSVTDPTKGEPGAVKKIAPKTGDVSGSQALLLLLLAGVVLGTLEIGRMRRSK